ncbi:MAG: glycosyltransferase family 2 protein [Bacteroidota bacterium]
MNSPRFSIISPSYNQASFIEANIQSVMNQDFSDVEHIIIDGGSTDGTIDILKKYPHLRWVSEPDNGQAHALNKGFKMAKGEIVGWVNSDDMYRPNIFKKVNDAFSDPHVMVVYGDGYEIDAGGRETKPMLTRGMTYENLVKYWTWSCEYVQPSFFYRRQVFQEVGYLDESLQYVMDQEYFIRLTHRYTLQYIPYALSNLRLYESSKTGKGMHHVISPWIWELHRVSVRHWGKPVGAEYLGYLFSFIAALIGSFFKNLFFVRGSKSRTALSQCMHRSVHTSL